jgi:hypothetical protein
MYTKKGWFPFGNSLVFWRFATVSVRKSVWFLRVFRLFSDRNQSGFREFSGYFLIENNLVPENY